MTPPTASFLSYSCDRCPFKPREAEAVIAKPTQVTKSSACCHDAMSTLYHILETDPIVLGPSLLVPRCIRSLARRRTDEQGEEGTSPSILKRDRDTASPWRSACNVTLTSSHGTDSLCSVIISLSWIKYDNGKSHPPANHRAIHTPPTRSMTLGGPAIED